MASRKIERHPRGQYADTPEDRLNNGKTNTFRLATGILTRESRNQFVHWSDGWICCTLFASQKIPIPPYRRPEVRSAKKRDFAFREEQVSGHRKSCVRFSTRTMDRWTSRFYMGGMENLRDRKRTGRPRLGTAQHAAWIHAAVVDQNPAPCQCQCAWWTAQRKPQASWEKFGIVLEVSPVRRILRRLSLTPQRSQLRAVQSAPADVQRGHVPECPARSPIPGVGSHDRLRRRVRAGCAERVWTPWGQPPKRVASRHLHLRWLAASSPEGQLQHKVREGPATAEVFRKFPKKIAEGADRKMLVVVANRRIATRRESRSGWRRTKPQQNSILSRPTRLQAIRSNG